MSGKGFHIEGVAETRMEHSIARKKRAKGYGKIKQARLYFMGLFIRTYLSEWQLYRGEDKFPRTTVMTSSQAADKNRAFDAQFMRRLDDDTNTKLWTWKQSDWKSTKAVMVQFIRDYVGRKHEQGRTEAIDCIQAMNKKNHPKAL